MYGTNNENSDTDYLYIYATSQNELLSCFDVHHQLQFIEDGIDHNFVSLHNFLKNCISGDSTINFEVIHSESLKETNLDWLCAFKNSFITYSINRSYLGLARRDIKHFYRYDDDYNKRKRLGHVVRGYLYAKHMFEKTFDFAKVNEEFKSIELNVSDSKMLKSYEQKISTLRDELNEKFNAKSLGLAQKFDVNAGISLQENLNAFCKLNAFTNKQNILTDFSMAAFINSFENWVEY
jgi:predicted nucleotidyltransferase